MNKYINKEGKNNIMSYMITYITKYGVVIASDSYSCYNDRALKDANYQKVHCIKENELYIGSTGLNVLIDENKQLIDINDTYKKFFANINDLNVEETIDKYIQLIQMSCDHFTQDVRLIIAYKYNTYIVDIQHMKRPKVEKRKEAL